VKRPILFTAGTLAGLATVLVANASTRSPLLPGTANTTTTTAGTSPPSSSATPGVASRTPGTPTGRQTPGTPTGRHASTTSAARSAAPGSSTRTASTTTTATPTAPPGPTATAASNQAVDGQPVTIPYGVVQVRLIITGHTISDVQPLQLPNADGHSQNIAAMAVPLLRQQVLSAQSAQINGVSGATYTSDGYARSVQSALDAIGGHP
jgi:uncharacterized protein with FMN-binding domain